MNYFEKEQDCIYGVIGTYNLLMKQLEQIFLPYGITTAKFNIMMIVKHQAPSDGISQIELSKKLIVGDSNISKLINRLVEQEFITREPNIKDRRYNLLKITEKGSKLLDEIWLVYLEKVKLFTDILDENEKELVNKITDKWKVYLSNV